MYLIVGLGNPEPEYSKTRHNMGFDVINKIAKKYEIDISRTKFNGLYGSGHIQENKVMLLKPQTFMNSSGQAIKHFINFYKIQLKKVLIIYDDMDIEIEQIRIRAKGSAGTHNGVKSVVHELGTNNFPRIRVGIGKPVNEYAAIDFVIGKVEQEIYEKLEIGIDKAVKALEDFIQNGIEHSMNIYN